MNPQVFDELREAFDQRGSAAAIERLCATLKDAKDYTGLFYALLLKKRVELGVPPVPTGSSQDLPGDAHAPYEEAIRQAGRLVGGLYLGEGNIPAAWAFFRMLGEPAPVHDALDKVQPLEGEDVHPLVDIAFHQGAHVRKGFDLLLERYGICSAITTLGGHDFPTGKDDRDYCIRRLVRSLYDELAGRLRAEIEQRQGFAPTATTVRELIAGRDWLFEDECYHIDLSHLSATVQMATNLDRGDELDLARELCEYGQKLSPRFGYQSDPPFENQYHDYGVFLSILAGDQVDEGLAHFRAKAAEADPETVGTYPAQVLVNLLLRLGRQDEALAAARQYLSRADETRLSCPGVVELCQRTGNYAVLADAARESGNAVHFVAGLIGAQGHGANLDSRPAP